MLRFDEAKATQATALFLALRGGQMHYMKLVKLLYLVDREALLRWGIPVTTDSYVSMDHGPVVSSIYDLIRRKVNGPTWEVYISPPMGDCDKEVRLIKPIKRSLLSPAEEKLIREVSEKYGHLNRYKLRDFVMHKLPEWHDPEGSSIPIKISDMLKAGWESEEEIRAVETELGIARISEDSFSRIS
jgi:uncharacterized phage-associated protein